MAKTVLVVDDEEVVVDITKRKLAQEGYLVLTAGNGEQALQVLREGVVDLILLDVEMPKMNGYEFMNERKKIPGVEDIPVIVLTAYDSMEPIFRRNKVAAYLTKPLRFQEVLAKVKEVVGAP
ncbi:MAG: response regulator [Candidatus Omnitrophica bacterium]|nr:response regulator [Candidatus Omnitrophota bacterium]